MRRAVLTLLISTCLMVCLLVFYRAYIVLNRTMPIGMTDADTVRWLDELGRIARGGSVLLHDLGIELGAQPLKIFINTALSVLFNPLPWQRVVYRDIKVSQDVYDGVLVSTYTPGRQKSLWSRFQGYPTIIYLHGGGWTWLSVGVYDGPLKHLANTTKFKVIAVEYRKSPEHPFPAAYNDCLSATRYIIQHARELNVCKELILLAGDGAGGNLATAIANEMTDQIKLQILINPALQMVNFATPSYLEFSGESVLPGITSPDKEISNWMRYGDISCDLKPILENNLHVSNHHADIFSRLVDNVKKPPLHNNINNKHMIINSALNITNKHTIVSFKHITTEHTNPNFAQNTTNKQTNPKSDHNTTGTSRIDNLIRDSKFNPMVSGVVKNVADAYIITSQYDVLRDEAILYGQRLQENGVNVVSKHYVHGFHGFFLFAGGGWIELKESQKALADLVNYLNARYKDFDLYVNY